LKITTGGRELIDEATLLVPKDEEAWIEFNASSSIVKVKILFVDIGDDPAPGYSLSGNDNHAVLTIKNWNNTLPMCIDEPARFGEEDGRGIYFQFIGDSVGGLKRIQIAFFWEAPQ
jgi:hypothetical protein